MTVENCVKLLAAYKKQMANPTNENGVPYTGEQRKHAMMNSKYHYEKMREHILNSRKFNGASITLRARGGGVGGVKVFEKHPIVDELKAEIALERGGE